ncbi:hypothetical protein, partial [Alteromonas sp. KUL17]|uniref:hypothetical protein n=1 Tax=Alteromonas sp. KUL17 TaxID=2480796 RepID=UPI001A94858D
SFDRPAVHTKVKVKNPNRWTAGTRNWDKSGSVKLNPENKKKQLNSSGDNFLEKRPSKCLRLAL